MDKDTTAAARFFKRVRTLKDSAKPIDPRVVFHDITPDEQDDITLISRRVYGNPYETLAVMASAGVNTVDERPKQKRIALPSPIELERIKRQTGIETNPTRRRNGAPTWA